MSVVGSYAITLEDEYSAVVKLTEVILFDENKKRIFHGEVEGSGTVVFNNVPEGEYTLIVVRDGYRHHKQKITVDGDKTINVTLIKI